jgi:spore maturation protein CgeB
MLQYGALDARVLYCSVDDAAYRPLQVPHRWDLSYLGTYSPDRQPMLERLLLEPARQAPELHFAVAGPQYPDDIAWPSNVEYLEHVAPADHAAFYAASRFTLNVTRADMIRAGWSPSVRLFEAAACGTPVVSDAWDGLDTLFVPGKEILVAEGPETVLGALLGLPEDDRLHLAAAARQRVLMEHTATHRAAELEGYLRETIGRCRASSPVRETVSS